MVPWTLPPPENYIFSVDSHHLFCFIVFFVHRCSKRLAVGVLAHSLAHIPVTVVWNAFSDIKFVILLVCWPRLLLPLPPSSSLPPLHPNIPTLSIQLTHICISFGFLFFGYRIRILSVHFGSQSSLHPLLLLFVYLARLALLSRLLSECRARGMCRCAVHLRVYTIFVSGCRVVIFTLPCAV